MKCKPGQKNVGERVVIDPSSNDDHFSTPDRNRVHGLYGTLSACTDCPRRSERRAANDAARKSAEHVLYVDEQLRISRYLVDLRRHSREGWNASVAARKVRLGDRLGTDLLPA